MDTLVKKLTHSVLPEQRLQDIVKNEFVIGEKNKTDISWFNVVQQLIEKLNSLSTVFFENVFRIIQINIKETLRRGLKDPKKYGKLYYTQLSKLLRKLISTDEHEEIPLAEQNNLTSVILAAAIDMQAASVRKCDENVAVEYISTNLSLVFSHSPEHKLDTLLRCRTLIYRKIRQPRIFLPLLKKLLLSTENRRFKSPQKFLKVLLLSKLWLFMTRKEEVVRTRSEITHFFKVPRNFWTWVEENEVPWLKSSATGNTHHILKSMTVLSALQTLYGGTAVAAKQVSSKENSGRLVNTKKRALPDSSSSENSGCSIQEKSENMKPIVNLKKRLKPSKVIESGKDRESSEQEWSKNLTKKLCPSTRTDGGKSKCKKVMEKKKNSEKPTEMIKNKELAIVENDGMEKVSVIREGKRSQSTVELDTDVESCRKKKRNNRDEEVTRKRYLESNEKISKVDMAHEEEIKVKKEEQKDGKATQRGQFDVSRNNKTDIAPKKLVKLKKKAAKKEQSEISEKMHQVVTEEEKLEEKKATEERESIKELKTAEKVKVQTKKVTEKNYSAKQLDFTEDVKDVKKKTIGKRESMKESEASDEVKLNTKKASEKRDSVVELKTTEKVKIGKKKTKGKRGSTEESKAMEEMKVQEKGEPEKRDSVKEIEIIIGSEVKGQQLDETGQDQKIHKGKSEKKKAGAAKNLEKKKASAVEEEQEAANKGEAGESVNTKERCHVQSEIKSKNRQTHRNVSLESVVKCEAEGVGQPSVDSSFKKIEIPERPVKTGEHVTTKEGKKAIVKAGKRIGAVDVELTSVSSGGTVSTGPSMAFKRQVNSNVTTKEANDSSSSCGEKGKNVTNSNKIALVERRQTKEPLAKSSGSALVSRVSNDRRHVANDRPKNLQGRNRQWISSFTVTDQSDAVEVEPKTRVRRGHDGKDVVLIDIARSPWQIQTRAVNPGVVSRFTDSNSLDEDSSDDDDVDNNHLGETSADLSTLKEEAGSMDDSDNSDNSESDPSEIILDTFVKEETSSRESDSADGEKTYSIDVKEESSSEDDSADETVIKSVKEESSSESDSDEGDEKVNSIMKEEAYSESDSCEGEEVVSCNIKKEASSESDSDEEENVNSFITEEGSSESNSDEEEKVSSFVKEEESSDSGSDGEKVNSIIKEETSNGSDSDDEEKVNSIIKEGTSSGSDSDDEEKANSIIKEEKSSESDSDEEDKKADSIVKEETCSENDIDDGEKSLNIDMKHELESSSEDNSVDGGKSVNNDIIVEDEEESSSEDYRVASGKLIESEAKVEEESISEDDSVDGEESVENDVKEKVSNSDRVENEETLNVDDISKGRKRSKKESNSLTGYEQPLESNDRNIEDQQITEPNSVNENLNSECNNDVGELETSVQELDEIVMLREEINLPDVAETEGVSDSNSSECTIPQATELSHQEGRQPTRTSLPGDTGKPICFPKDDTVVVDLDSDSDIEILQEDIVPKIPRARRRMGKRSHSHSNVDEASGSDSDIASCDEGQPVFTEGEIEGYHSKLTACEIQRKVEKMMKEEEKLIKSRRVTVDANQEMEEDNREKQHVGFCGDVNKTFCNLYTDGHSKGEPQGGNRESAERSFKTSTSNQAERGITLCQVRRENDRTVACEVPTGKPPTVDHHNPSGSYKAKKVETDDEEDCDSDTDIEFVLQTIVQDTGRMSSIVGVRERILKNDAIKEEEEDDTNTEDDSIQFLQKLRKSKPTEETSSVKSIKNNVEQCVPVLTSHSSQCKKDMTACKDGDSCADTVGTNHHKETVLSNRCDTEHSGSPSEAGVVENIVVSENKVNDITDLSKKNAVDKPRSGFNCEYDRIPENLDRDKESHTSEEDLACEEREIQRSEENTVSGGKEVQGSEENVVNKKEAAHTSNINPTNGEKGAYTDEEIFFNGEEDSSSDNDPIIGDNEAHLGEDNSVSEDTATCASVKCYINREKEALIDVENLINREEDVHTSDIKTTNGEREVDAQGETVADEEKHVNTKELFNPVNRRIKAHIESPEKEAYEDEENTIRGEEEARASDESPVDGEDHIHPTDDKVTHEEMINHNKGDVDCSGDRECDTLSKAQCIGRPIFPLENDNVEIHNVHCDSAADVEEKPEFIHNDGGTGDENVITEMKDFDEATKEDTDIDNVSLCSEVPSCVLSISSNCNQSESEEIDFKVSNINCSSDAEDAKGNTDSVHSDDDRGDKGMPVYVKDFERITKEEFDIHSTICKELNIPEVLVENDCNPSASENLRSDSNVCRPSLKHFKNDLILNRRTSPVDAEKCKPASTVENEDTSVFPTFPEYSDNTPQKSCSAVVILSEAEITPKGNSTCINLYSVDEEDDTKSLDVTDDAYEASSDASEDSTPVMKKRLRNLRKNANHTDLPEASDSEPSPVEKKRRRRTVGTCGVTCQKSKRKGSQSCFSETEMLLKIQAPLTEKNLLTPDVEKCEACKQITHSVDEEKDSALRTRQTKNNLVLSDSEIVCRKSVRKHICAWGKIHTCTKHAFSPPSRCSTSESEVRENEFLEFTSEHNREDFDTNDVEEELDISQSCEKVTKTEGENLSDADVLDSFSAKRNCCLATDEDLNEVDKYSTENIDEGEELEVLSTSEVEEKDELSCSDNMARSYDDSSGKACSSTEMKTCISPKLLSCKLGNLSGLKSMRKESSPDSFKPDGIHTHVIPRLKVHRVSEAVLTKEVLISPEVSDEECELMSPIAIDDQEMERSPSSQVGSYGSEKRLNYLCGRKRISGGIRSPQKVIPEEQDESTLPKDRSDACVKFFQINKTKSHSRSPSLEKPKPKNQSPTKNASRGSLAKRQTKEPENSIIGSDAEVSFTPKILRSKSTSHKQELSGVLSSSPVSAVPPETSPGENVRTSLRSNRTMGKQANVDVKDDIPFVKEVGFSNTSETQSLNTEEEKATDDEKEESNGTHFDDSEIELNKEQQQQAATSRRMTSLLRRSSRLKSKSSEDENPSGDTKKLRNNLLRTSPRPRRKTRTSGSSSETFFPASGDILDASVNHTPEKEGLVTFCQPNTSSEAFPHLHS